MNTVTHLAGSGHAPGGVESPVRSFMRSLEDEELVERLRSWDEASFMSLVQRYHGSLVRLAQSFVSSRAVAEEVAQEAWLGVLQGIDRFEGRSSLRTWLFQILVNRAKTRGRREMRSVSFSSLNLERDTEGPAVNPNYFTGQDSDYPGHWMTAPQNWESTPEQTLLSQECQTRIEQAIADLPAIQRQVITLRDVQGWRSEEVCNILGLTESNCRVLLHRARSKVRQALEEYLGVNPDCQPQLKRAI